MFYDNLLISIYYWFIRSLFITGQGGWGQAGGHVDFHDVMEGKMQQKLHLSRCCVCIAPGSTHAHLLVLD